MFTVGAVELQLAVRIYRMNATQGKIIEGMRQKFSGIQGRRLQCPCKRMEVTGFYKEEGALDDVFSYIEEQDYQLGGCKKAGCRVDERLVKGTAFEDVWGVLR